MKDFSKMSIEELHGSLILHERRINERLENSTKKGSTEKVLQALTPKGNGQGQSNNGGGDSHARGQNFRARGCGGCGNYQGRGRGNFQFQQREKCIIISYSSETKGYKLFNPDTGKIIIIRDVTFDEKGVWDWKKEEPKSPQPPTPMKSQLPARLNGYAVGDTVDHLTDEDVVNFTLFADCDPVDFKDVMDSANSIMTPAEERLRLTKDGNDGVVNSSYFKSLVGSLSKHIDIKYHFIRDLVRENEIAVNYCKSEDQVTDIFTKGLKMETFMKLKKMLGMENVANLV
ncbi:hypothetical protein ZIOFF_005151 [Zingiber officinale]|uniref:Retroviral polymerase SH3-like domain-containing protein n=1 Tax=Zingiber officinale TaxID=94328 RepID=A0A8J5IA41_ZINOF|nr:hypothetical protein ZIOFF_005151 [Zingiber officinale]